MTEIYYDYPDFYKIDLIASGIANHVFWKWLSQNDITDEDYFYHPQLAGIVYFVEEEMAMACKLLGTKDGKSII